MKYSDAQAKDILRDSKHWPACTERWGPKGHRWIRAQPVDTGKDAKSGPRIHAPGQSLFKTQPDGLWLHFEGIEFVDVIVIDLCGTIQNLNDKRSRFTGGAASVMVKIPEGWLGATVKWKKGVQPRWKATGVFSELPSPADLPVRHLRVLFGIPDNLYSNWIANNVPCGHEYFMAHGSLKSATSQRMSEFLKHMSLDSHFYTNK